MNENNILTLKIYNTYYFNNNIILRSNNIITLIKHFNDKYLNVAKILKLKKRMKIIHKNI